MTACTELLHAWQLYRVAPSLRAPQSSRHRTGPTKVKAHQAAVRQACAGTGARRGFLHCRAAVDGADGQQPATSPSSWDTQTDRLVSVSTIFFLLLLVPQIVQNASSLMAGNSSALAALSWVGFVTALSGNITLLAYFIDQGEKGAAAIQAIGAASNYAVLSQTFMAGYAPAPVFAAMSGVAAVGAVLCGMRNLGKLANRGTTQAVWQFWLDLLGVAGVGLLVQAVTLTCGGQSPIAGPLTSGVTLLLLVLDRTSTFTSGFAKLWNVIPAWSATLLFGFQPVAQLASNMANPANLAGVSAMSLLLGTSGNALMAPRALRVRDPVWLAGSSWGSVMGWAQLATLFMAHSPSGQRMLGSGAFVSVTLALVGYIVYVLYREGTQQDSGGSLSSQELK